MADTDLIENLISAIKLTQKLRASVTEVFSDLSDGFNITHGNEKSLLSELQKPLCALNNDFNELEKLSAGMSAPPQSFTSSYLTLDPVLDKTSLYSQLLLAHKWSNKVQEVAGHAATLLHQNQLKRSQQPSMLQSMQNKRIGRVSVHNISSTYVDNCVAKLDRLQPYMSNNIVLNRPMGACAVLEITIGKTMRVLVVLRGLIIEWVTVKGYHEDFRNEDGKLDIWSKSRYQVFQKVTDHCSAAMLHFFSPSTVYYADAALQSFYMWLSSYRTLFSSCCHKCSKYLVNNLPPTWRDFRSRQMEPYHECCRS